MIQINAHLFQHLGLRAVSYPAIVTNTYDTQNGPIHAVAETDINQVDYSYTYDANGNLTEGPDFTDVNNIGTRTITYNADNKTTHVVHTGGMTMDLYYDGGGGRTKKVVSGGSTTYYFGEHYEVKDGVATKYIFARSARIAQVTNTDTNYFHKDHLGSSSVMTNSLGAVIESTDYLPFGETRSHTGTEVSNYKFTDQELDPESGLYNYDARMYDPVIGLFTTADIVVQDYTNPQTLNRYAYCGNNPLAYVDPSGHLFWAALAPILMHAAIGVAIGSAIGGAFAAITGQDIGQGFLTGAISGAFFGGVGGYISFAGSAAGSAAGLSAVSMPMQVAMHAMAGMASGAVNASITGGNIGMGVVTSGLSAGIAKYAGMGFLDKLNNFGLELAGRSIVGGITGGIAAEMYGGKFMDGFVMGAESAAFGTVCNEFVSDLIEGKYFGTGFGAEATEYYATQYDKTGNFGYALAGGVASLWTPETWGKTTLTLAGAKTADSVRKNLIFEGPRATRIFQVRLKVSGKPIFRVDYGPVPGNGIQLHYHRFPDMNLHRPYEGGW